MSHEDIVISDRPVLMLGGAVTEAALRVVGGLLAEPDLAGAPVVAVDGGARLAISAGLTPQAVIGDFDSLGPDEAAQFDPATLHRITEQETTDFDKALRSVRAPVVLGAGFHGARIDHHLAALSVLARFPDRHCILVGTEDVTCLCPPELAIDLSPGDWLSLFPLAEVQGTSSGLEWPIDGLRFRPDHRIGTSNRVTEGRVRLQMTAPGMLLILPRRALRPLLAALSRSGARWPARAG
ncbi:thiamine pyrophosphokinase [Pseudooceanicola batsensis HTCC2597]|uniref:Thiamine diphosphokinase n=1 Tax=Pseudooceanicola batsensis (strain ATCC BAA-863 / DSM 15984 / KCTC 12145 / HTCC2597) TaxID=252305 RepID=A3TUM5_PSEBH|nr:thiamine diphosphokinase [Pseudooceanicola batsensis]EAQ04221.1 thiamine pyrophosphokinase [Pseudooceanicola batsensis HTCC2597]